MSKISGPLTLVPRSIDVLIEGHRETVEKVLTPLGLWDPKTFFLWHVLYVS